MKYFLHDTSAFSDEKITELHIEYGFEGVGLFYTILERIALQEKPISEKVLMAQLGIKKRLAFQAILSKTFSLSCGNSENESLLPYIQRVEKGFPV